MATKIIEHIGKAEFDGSYCILTKENGMKVVLNPNREIHVLNCYGKYGNDMSNWMDFNTFMHHCMTGLSTCDAELAFAGWVDMYYVLKAFEDKITCQIDLLVPDEDYFCAHIFTDGKSHAVIWSSEAAVKEFVPYMGHEIVYIGTEFAVIKL